MAPAAPSFAVLLSRARERDPEAADELGRQYEPRLRVVARVLLGPALRPVLDSMDLVQSVHRSLLIGIRRPGATVLGVRVPKTNKTQATDGNIRVPAVHRMVLLATYRHGKDVQMVLRAHIELPVAEGWSYREVRVIYLRVST